MEKKSRVGLFVTCLIDLVRPRIGFSVIKLIEDAGYEVSVPDRQTCCGQPAFNSGDTQGAHVLARKFVNEFSEFDYIVVPSGSCAGMIKTHYVEAVSGDRELRRELTTLLPRVFELTDFLLRVAKVTELSSNFEGRITYHDSCSGLRELGISKQPRALLAKVPGAELLEMKDCQNCCGFGGAFAVKYGAISTAIVDDKIKNIHGSGAGAVVLGDLGCMLNIEGRLRRKGDVRTQVLHIAEVLAGES